MQFQNWDDIVSQVEDLRVLNTLNEKAGNYIKINCQFLEDLNLAGEKVPNLPLEKFAGVFAVEQKNGMTPSQLSRFEFGASGEKLVLYRGRLDGRDVVVATIHSADGVKVRVFNVHIFETPLQLGTWEELPNIGSSENLRWYNNKEIWLDFLSNGTEGRLIGAKYRVGLELNDKNQERISQGKWPSGIEALTQEISSNLKGETTALDFKFHSRVTPSEQIFYQTVNGDMKIDDSGANFQLNYDNEGTLRGGTTLYGKIDENFSGETYFQYLNQKKEILGQQVEDAQRTTGARVRYEYGKNGPLIDSVTLGGGLKTKDGENSTYAEFDLHSAQFSFESDFTFEREVRGQEISAFLRTLRPGGTSEISTQYESGQGPEGNRHHAKLNLDHHSGVSLLGVTYEFFQDELGNEYMSVSGRQQNELRGEKIELRATKDATGKEYAGHLSFDVRKIANYRGNVSIYVLRRENDGQKATHDVEIGLKQEHLRVNAGHGASGSFLDVGAQRELGGKYQLVVGGAISQRDGEANGNIYFRVSPADEKLDGYLSAIPEYVRQRGDQLGIQLGDFYRPDNRAPELERVPSSQ